MKRFFAFFVFAAMLLGSCTIKPSIPGTWTDSDEGITLILGTGGEANLTKEGEPPKTGEYAETDTKLLFIWNGSRQLFDISLTSDGQKMILNNERDVMVFTRK